MTLHDAQSEIAALNRLSEIVVDVALRGLAQRMGRKANVVALASKTVHPGRVDSRSNLAYETVNPARCSDVRAVRGARKGVQRGMRLLALFAFVSACHVSPPPQRPAPAPGTPPRTITPRQCKFQQCSSNLECSSDLSCQFCSFGRCSAVSPL